MADDVQRPGTSSKVESTQVEAAEDAETRAARRELKQSSISDQLSTDGEEMNRDRQRQDPPSLAISEPKNHEFKEQISSPKKKRAHDQLDGNEGVQESDTTSVTSSDSAKDRTARHEPEKKRCREKESSEPKLKSPLLASKEKTKENGDDAINTATDKISRDVSSIPFAASAFGQLASEPSGFASLGSFQGRGFSSVKPKLSSFSLNSTPTLGSVATLSTADHAPPAKAPKLSFTSESGASPFAGISSNANGFWGAGFGPPSASSGCKPLGNFAPSITKPLQSEKAARPFGAPDSDVGEDDEDDEDDGDSEGQVNDKVRRASPDRDSEDKKRPKLHKIEVDDGEAGEVTVLSVRAKMFSHDKQTGWKERGAGMLKINVPHACVEFNDSGAVIPGSFDASGLEADEKSVDGKCRSPKVARLILRQDQTHRVILNTAILPAMEFQEKTSLKSVGILFTALEGNDAKPVSITIRMSAANSKLFLNEINAIQRELRGN
ncbi:hypothetical protein E4U41_001043 [Claviceps citrina]|nr:hypothetical protein E4U41_001043 [Claviceps citrina]